MKTINLHINKDNIIGEIPQYLFGHFIEFMHDCIDPGLHAQLLISRGFEFSDKNQDGISDPWYGVGLNDSYKYQLSDKETLSPSFSQEIRIFNHYDGHRGVAQKGLRLENNQEYGGYIWLKSPDTVNFTIKIFDCDEDAIFSRDWEVKPGDWKKYEFNFKNQILQKDARIELCLTSEGVIWLDQASLMPASVPCGVWPAVMDKIKALNPSILRFPGGCFADCYHWEDGIGPVDLRPSKVNLHWGGMEQNNFGTDEFVELCRYLNCEPMICINFGAAEPEEAANWVEYCNGEADTKYGAMRAANGHPEPYQIVYWDIGNETFGDWEIGHCNAEEYSERYLKFSCAMKEKNQKIKLVACAGDGNYLDQSWNKEILNQLKGQVDVLGLHTYTPMIMNNTYNNTDIYYAVTGAAPQKYDTIVKECAKTIENIYGKNSGVKLGITEWNTSYHNDSLREHTLESALCNAGMMNMFIRNCNSISLSNTSDLINGWPGGLIRTESGVAIGTPTYYTIRMYANAGLSNYIESEYQCERFDTKEIGNINACTDVPYVDIVSCINTNGNPVLLIINRYLDEEVSLCIKGVQENLAEIQTLWSEKASDSNGFTFEKIVPYSNERKINEIIIQPHSANVIVLK